MGVNIFCVRSSLTSTLPSPLPASKPFKYAFASVATCKPYKLRGICLLLSRYPPTLIPSRLNASPPLTHPHKHTHTHSLLCLPPPPPPLQPPPSRCLGFHLDIVNTENITENYTLTIKGQKEPHIQDSATRKARGVNLPEIRTYVPKTAGLVRAVSL